MRTARAARDAAERGSGARIGSPRAAVSAPGAGIGVAGLAPRLHESGSSVRRKARLSKAGAPRLRKALYFPAISAIRYNPYVKDLSERLRARGKCPMQVIGAAMRKLIHLAYGVLKSGRPFDPEMKTA